MTEIKDKGVPTGKTKGALGYIYTDTNTGAVYKCTAAYIINGSESYEWKRISESKAEKIPVEKIEENKVENVEQSFEPFMNPPVEPEVVEDIDKSVMKGPKYINEVILPKETDDETLKTRNELFMEGTKAHGKHNYGKYYNKNKHNKN